MDKDFVEHHSGDTEYFGAIEVFHRELKLHPRVPQAGFIFVTELGDLGGGPRDLLDMHVAALDRALALYQDPHARAIVYESRLLALQMMGLLVDYYRVGHRRRTLEESKP